MVKSDTQLYKFGKFQVDTIKRVLLRDSTPVQLPSRAFDVLLALVDHNQYVIDKDELMRMVWGERVVEENNLTRHVSTLRKVLDESPNDHRYIVTVPGRGYSFVAEVERITTTGGQAVSATPNDGASGIEALPRNRVGQVVLEGITRSDSLDVTVAPALDGESGGQARTARSRKIRLWAAAVIVILAAAGILVLNLFSARTRSAALKTYRDWEIVRLTRTGDSIAPDISHDGKYVAYVNHELGSNSVWIHQLATSTQLQLVPPEKFSYRQLHFSPDGSELYFLRLENSTPLGTLYRIPVFGGAARKLRDDVVSIVMISSDGAHLAFARRNREGKTEFVISNTDGVEERVLVDHAFEFPAWSPDGKVIAFSVGNAESGGERMGIHEIRLSDGAQKEITSQKWQHAGDKVWLPDGSGLIVSARDQKTHAKQLWFVAYPSGETRPLSDDLDNFSHVRVTADARMLVAQQFYPVSDIWSSSLADVAGGKKIGTWGMGGLCLMADGRVVYSGLLSEASNELWMMNADGSERKQLTFDSGDDLGPAASPDGRYVVFVSNRSGNFEIWRMNPDGSNLLQLTRTNGANSPDVSPDNRWVVYLSAGYLCKIPLEGGEPVRVCKADGASCVSPDGKLIAYFAAGKEALGIVVSSFEDGSAIRKFDVGSLSLNKTSLKWTPDGKALLYSLSSDGVANIWMQPLDGGLPKRMTDFKSDGIFRFDVSSDGKNLVCARGGWRHDVVLIKHLR